MGKWKAVFPIMLALVIAVVGSVSLYKWINMQTKPKETVKVESKEAIPVAVAKVGLPWGTKLTKAMIKEVPYLRESLPEGYASDMATLTGRVLIASVQENEPILESRLAPTDITTGGVSAVIKPGNRAIAVKGDKVIGISGFVRPGNRLDVLVTLKDPRSKKDVTKTVLENVLVLATGTEIKEGVDGKASPVDVYTLEVTPHEGERLALAAIQGRLQFALRNISDAKTVLTKGATIPGTLAFFKEPVKQKPGKRMHTVEVIRGGKILKKKLGI